MSLLLALLLAVPADKEVNQYLFEIKLYQGNPNGSREKGDVELLSSPQIVTWNEQEAQIKVGQKIPLIVNRKEVDGKIVNTVKEQEVGFNLKLMPTGSKDGIVYTRLHAEISEVMLGASAHTTIYQQHITTMRELKLGEKVRVPFYHEKPDRQNGGKKQAKSYTGHEVWMEVTVSEVKR